VTNAGEAVPTLMYHEIAAAPRTTSRLAVAPEAFAAQLAYLDHHGFTTLTAGRLATALSGQETQSPERSVVLTFDDGFADFHETALPLLQRYGFTATVFVTTGWIRDARQRAGSPPGRMLSWSQLAEAASAGIEIGAHSYQHPQLDQLGRHMLLGELADSKAALEDGLGMAVPGLAYPFGYSNASVRMAARDLGYSYACAVGNRHPGQEPDIFALPRLTIGRQTRLSAFGKIADCRILPLIYFRQRSLTKAWAAARHTRSALRVLGRESNRATQ
jgi:peptidoglycan/xylan/chitin deacetylase (PgdA/CDA1 family)